jgi:hypothetical protein
VSTGFSVDFDALERAAAGVAGVLQEVSTQPLSQIPCDTAVIGHPGLAAALADFLSGWQQGVDDLVTEGAGIVQRLHANVAAYQEAEADVREHIVRVCGGLFGAGVDPGVS